jgi:hypothetical protein
MLVSPAVINADFERRACGIGLAAQDVITSTSAKEHTAEMAKRLKVLFKESRDSE